jgi:hypothetical protein
MGEGAGVNGSPFGVRRFVPRFPCGSVVPHFSDADLLIGHGLAEPLLDSPEPSAHRGVESQESERRNESRKIRRFEGLFP